MVKQKRPLLISVSPHLQEPLASQPRGLLSHPVHEQVAQRVHAANDHLAADVGEAEVLDRPPHALDEDPVVRGPVDHPHHAQVLAGGGDGVGQVGARHVDSHNLQGYSLVSCLRKEEYCPAPAADV